MNGFYHLAQADQPALQGFGPWLLATAALRGLMTQAPYGMDTFFAARRYFTADVLVILVAASGQPGRIQNDNLVPLDAQ